MQNELKKIGAKVYLYEKDALVKKSPMFMRTELRASHYHGSFTLECLQTLFCSGMNVRSDFMFILSHFACMIQM